MCDARGSVTGSSKEGTEQHVTLDSHESKPRGRS